MTTQFEVPPEFMNQNVFVTLRGIVLSDKSGGVGLGGGSGLVVADHPSAVVLQTQQTCIFGPPGRVLIPKDTIQSMTMVGHVQMLAPGTLLKGAGH